MRRGMKVAAVLAVIIISLSAVCIIAYSSYNADRPFDTKVTSRTSSGDYRLSMTSRDISSHDIKAGDMLLLTIRGEDYRAAYVDDSHGAGMFDLYISHSQRNGTTLCMRSYDVTDVRSETHR